jgi:hypothetical protein
MSAMAAVGDAQSSAAILASISAHTLDWSLRRLPVLSRLSVTSADFDARALANSLRPALPNSRER